MTTIATLALGMFAMFTTQTRLSERALADIGSIGVPRMVKDEMYKGIRDDQPGRLTFTFSTSYFWASFGSSTAYKHQLFVSLMAADASEAQYAELPSLYRLSYEGRKTVRTTTLGSGKLTVSEGVYMQNTLEAPAHTFVYVDRARRLQITWHAVKEETGLDDGIAAIGRMAASFKLARDPVAQFAEMRDRPRKDAEDRAHKRALATATLEREGFGPLEPGKPVLKNGVYVEWMADPEPRFQLLVPLGRLRIPPNATPVNRPRPVRQGNNASWPPWGVVGWREFTDGEWAVSNYENAYLPFKGIAAALAAEGQDPAFVYFYYSATVRVEEESGDERLANLRWFLDTVPEAKRLWREGKLAND